MATNDLSKLWLLLWKNWILQWNHKFQLIVELILPACFSLLLVMTRSVGPTFGTNATIYDESFPLDSFYLLKQNTYDTNLTLKLLYSPNTTMVFDNLAKEAADSLKIPYSGYANSKDLQFALLESDILAGVEFDDSMANLTKLPSKLNFRVRFPTELRTRRYYYNNWLTNNRFLLDTKFGPRNKYENDGGSPVGYLREGFLAVQNAVSRAFLKQSNKRYAKALPEVELQRYPYPKYDDDVLVEVLGTVLPVVIFLSYIYSSTWMVKFITSEKEKQLKEVMKMMGLQNSLHWTAWFLQGLLGMGISTLLVMIIIKIKWHENGAVLVNSSFTAVYFFFFMYSAATAAFCLMLATFFSKASTAASVTGLIWCVTFIPYMYFNANGFVASTFTKVCWSLLVNTAMGLGIHIIVGHESDGHGFQWTDMLTPLNPDDTLTMAHIIGVMFFSCCLYMIICLYVEQIYPGEFGVPREWYFPFTKSFWFEDKGRLENESSTCSYLHENAESFEVEPIGKRIGLEVKNLTKKFGQHKAVKGISMNLFEDQITVLLGHNGAGKTTTISMLTGMFPPTSGTAIVNGCDIRTNINGARSSLGICPQHNILFDELTVRQHLIFYGRLKGLKGPALETEVNGYIKKIELENKANVASSELSGGMKRKLSVCAAFCGGSKVVMCDEPSSGMDPAARRQLWDLLQAEKAGRTVLLTTHFMDEADVLGDRIAIMSAGELKCMGSPFFLKKKFGSGYVLICVKKNECITSQVTELLSKYIPDLKPEADIGAELSYQLPEKYSSHFESMFHDLETNSDQLSLNGYGVSITSLEEVFLKVGAEKPKGTKTAQHNYNQSHPESVKSMGHQNLLTGFSLTVNQWKAMIIKKSLYTIRNKMLFLVQNIIPILFITSTLSGGPSGSFSQLSPMTVSLTQYPETVTILSTTSDVKNNSIEWNIIKNYKDLINSYGYGHHLEETGKQNFIDYVLEPRTLPQGRFDSMYIAAATIGPKKITAWLNNEPLHSAPLTINLINNAMARTLIGPEASISVTNAPLPNIYTEEASSGSSSIMGIQLALILGFCMCIVSGFYVMFIIKERETRAKHLQFVSGVRVATFWLTNLVWDLVTFTITSVIVMIALAIFQVPGFATFHELGRIMLLFLLFGFSVMPFTYLLSYFFSETSTGFSRLSVINLICGIIFFTIVFILRETKSSGLFEKFCLLLPHFSLTQGIFKLYMNFEARDRCENQHMCYGEEASKKVPYFAWEYPGVLREIIGFVVSSILYLILLLLKDYGLVDRVLLKVNEQIRKPPSKVRDDSIDEDVEEERIRVENMSWIEISTQNLVLDKFTKYYSNFLAVNQISVGVKHAECFGLLGVNGAGKTTTFKILTGDEKIFLGEAYVKGLSLKTKMRKVNKEIGYCPQFDALFDDLTGQETLKIFGLLRGVPSDKIKDVSLNLAESLGFMQHYTKPVRAYSGGNKRKLSTAVAILGTPSLVYLDEPTTGMDPAARRQLWNVLCRIRDAGTSIVLTSHSMEECEALCTRLAIMVNGEFKCIGSTQHLKNRFSKGLVLKLKIKKALTTTVDFLEEDIQKVTSFITEEFAEANLQERFQRILTFYIPLSSISWSKVFGLMERNKEDLGIEDYSISQTTLEEIFLQFAKDQRNDPREAKKKCFGFC